MIETERGQNEDKQAESEGNLVEIRFFNGGDEYGV